MMLRTSLSVIAMTLLAGAAQAAPVPAPADTSRLVINVATSEDQTIEQDQNTQPSSPDQSLQHQSQPSDQMGPAEKGQMNEDNSDINN